MPEYQTIAVHRGLDGPEIGRFVVLLSSKYGYSPTLAQRAAISLFRAEADIKGGIEIKILGFTAPADNRAPDWADRDQPAWLI